jgi:hypothetical protein
LAVGVGLSSGDAGEYDSRKDGSIENDEICGDGDYVPFIVSFWSDNGNGDNCWGWMTMDSILDTVGRVDTSFKKGIDANWIGIPSASGREKVGLLGRSEGNKEGKKDPEGCKIKMDGLGAESRKHWIMCCFPRLQNSREETLWDSSW